MTKKPSEILSSIEIYCRVLTFIICVAISVGFGFFFGRETETVKHNREINETVEKMERKLTEVKEQHSAAIDEKDFTINKMSLELAEAKFEIAKLQADKTEAEKNYIKINKK